MPNKQPQSYWRRHARQIVIRLLADAQTRGLAREELVLRLRLAYPFGEREYHPYQIWLSERRLCLAAFDAKTTIAAVIDAENAKAAAARPAPALPEPDPNQLELPL